MGSLSCTYRLSYASCLHPLVLHQVFSVCTLSSTSSFLDLYFTCGSSHRRWKYFECLSGVARAFPGGQPAHPEPQIEEANEEKLRKDDRKSRRMRKNWGNVAFLPTRGWESGYAPGVSCLSCTGCDVCTAGRDTNRSTQYRSRSKDRGMSCALVTY